MVQFYAEVLRSVQFRDNNWKPLASTDPTNTTLGWTKDAGVTATSDGDILSLSGTDATHGLSRNISITPTNGQVVVRAKASVAMTLDVVLANIAQTVTLSLTTSYQTFNASLTAGTVTQIKFQNQSVSGTISIDYVYLCNKTPLQISSKDLKNATVTRTSLGNDHAEIELDNFRGKFTASIFGSGGASAIGFGDHLHIYAGQASTLYHVYGGYVELENPVLPPDNLLIHSRGFGLALLRSKVLQIYNNSLPTTIVSDVLNSFVNATNKNGLGIASNYQLTQSFVQVAIGLQLPLYVASLNNAFNTLHELADLTVFQGTPAIFFVDPAENLHWVPLGVQGSANWNTDPFTALNTSGMTYGTNISTTTLSRDTQSIVNRVHYYGIAQVPGQVDGITEYSTNGALQADWDTELLNIGPTVASLSTASSPVAVGSHCNDMTLTPAGGNSAQGAFIYPKTHTNTLLDFTKLGSQWSPPIVEFYIRCHPNSAGGNGTFWGGAAGVTAPGSIFYFANDSSNRFTYRLTFAGGSPGSAVLATTNGQNDFWYHALFPVGPNAGNLFLSAPAPNIIPQPTLLTPPYEVDVGAPVWSTIKYFGFYTGGTDATTGSLDFYVDGFRIVGGRYRLAYDNRTLANGRYVDMSEAYYYDPVSKDETAIKGFAGAELLKLRNGLVRGSVVGPLRADIVPEQQVQVTVPSANLSSQYLRCTTVTHHFSTNGFLTELALTDDFTNSRPLDQWKLMNALLEMGENAIFSRQLYDLRTAVLDPTFTPLTDPYT